MAITGKFEADFTQFHSEVKKAEHAMESFEGGMVTVKTGLYQLSDTGGGAWTTFHQGLSTADKTLAAFGVHIGPEIQAIRELGLVSGKTAAQIGLIGTAGLAVGVALAGWKAGRMIAEFFDLDKAIADTTANLLGWGNVAAETAAVKADAMARATKTAGREITDYTEAVKINTAAATAYSASLDTSRARVAAWQKEFRELRQRGDLEAFKKELDSGNSSLKQLSIEYGVSVEAIQNFQRETAKATAVQKARAESDAAYAKLMREVYNEIGQAQMDADKATMDRQEANREGERLFAIDRIKWEEEVAEAAKTAAEKAEAARQAEYDAWWKSVNEGVLVVGAAIQAVDAEVANSLQRTSAAVTSWQQAMQMVTSGQGTLSGTVQAGGPFQATRAQIQESHARGEYWGPVDQFGNPDYRRLGMAGGTTVYVDARDSFIDSNAGLQRIADRVSTAISSRQRAIGARM